MNLTQNMSDPVKSKRVLVFGYAFPPMQVQMSPVAARAVAGLRQQGFAVDVLAGENFLPFIPSDSSLMPYVQRHSEKVHYIQRENKVNVWLDHYDIWFKPDVMADLGHNAYKYIMSLDLKDYAAIITFSPFHSINSVMVRVKKSRPQVRWIAHFCDPWSSNPLEKDWLRRLWNEWNEPRMLSVVDFVTHSSKFTLDMMLQKYQSFDRNKALVIPHFFDPTLYPLRDKASNPLITLRFVGTLFGRRSPEPMFQAILNLLIERVDLKDVFRIELIGNIEKEMLSSQTLKSLPEGLIHFVPSVSYLKSLELMYDADILLLIEADTDFNLFVPSKLTDYMGANTPIVGIVAHGGSQEILGGLGCAIAHPNNIKSIEKVLESAIDSVQRKAQPNWCREEFRNLFSLESVSKQFADLIVKLQGIK